MLKMYELARSFLFIVISYIIFYFGSFSGFAAGAHLFYFPLFLAIVNIYNFEDKKERGFMWSHILLNVVLILINAFTGYSLFLSKTLSEETILKFFSFNLIFSILCIGYFLYFIVHMNMQQKKLINKLTEAVFQSKNSEEKKQINTDILLAELEHRLKNNLSLMSSLIRLKLDKINNDNIQLKINEVSHAIQVVADANRFVIFNEHCLNVPVLIYFNEVIESWKQLKANENKQAKFNLNVIDHEINIKQAIPLALIIHELMVLFCNQEESNHEDHYLNINLTKEGVFNITSSIESLLEIGDKYEYLIKVLTDQLDAELISLNKNEFEIHYDPKTDQKKIESEAIFA